MRIVPPLPKTIKHGNVRCAECGSPTREGKKFCTTHLDKIPYAAKIIQEVAVREQEIALLDAGRYVKPDAYIIDDAVKTLKEEGKVTVRGLRRTLQLSNDAMATLIRVLIRNQLVKTEPAPRYQTWISLL